MSIASPPDLMRLHVEALFTQDPSGSLLQVNEPGGAPAPRFFLGITSNGSVRCYRHDVDDDIRRSLDMESRRDFALAVPVRSERYEHILSRAAPVRRTWTGPAFNFPETLTDCPDAVPIDSSNSVLLRDFFGGWIEDVDTCRPMFAVIVDGRAVALCASVRRTTAAHEAGVETAAPYRGAGFGGRAVSAWASSVRAMARVPLYSTSWNNDASRAVARKLGLIQFGNDLHIT